LCTGKPRFRRSAQQFDPLHENSKLSPLGSFICAQRRERNQLVATFGWIARKLAVPYAQKADRQVCGVEWKREITYKGGFMGLTVLLIFLWSAWLVAALLASRGTVQRELKIRDGLHIREDSIWIAAAYLCSAIFGIFVSEVLIHTG